MAKKTYKTYHLKGLQLLLFDESGRTIEVNFKGGCQIDSTAKFSTNDEKVQKALEKCSGFNRDFYLDSERENDPSAATALDGRNAEDNGDIQTVNVSCKADAVEWLKEHYPEKGYNGNNLRSKEAFETACKENRVTFVFTGE